MLSGRQTLATLLVLGLATAVTGCGSDEGGNPPAGTGGASGTRSGGASGSRSGGSSGSSTGGSTGAGGSVSTGGSMGSSGGAGGTGAGGSVGGAGGSGPGGSGGSTGDAAGEAATEGGASVGEFKLVVTGITMRNGRNYFVRGQTNGTGNMSPGFEWGAHPEAKSYALTMIDMSNGGTHWVMYDIPTTVTKLPPALMRPSMPDVPEVPGAKHTRFSGSNPYGYFGPGAGSCNQYHFIIHAMKVDKLTATGDKNAMRAAVNNAANKLASTPAVVVIGNNSAGMCN